MAGIRKMRRGIRKIARRSRMRTRRSSKRLIGRNLFFMKPEVKYTRQDHSTDVAGRTTSTTSLGPSDYLLLFAYPSQGTTDNTRIGDSIKIKNIWIRFQLENVTNVNANSIRIIIFTLSNGAPPTPGTTTIASFWQVASGKQAILGTVNREVVHNVWYDKVHTILSQTLNTRTPTKMVNINIRLKKLSQVTFASGSADPKNITQRFYIAFLAHQPGASSDSLSGYMNLTTTMYYVG